MGHTTHTMAWIVALRVLVPAGLLLAVLLLAHLSLALDVLDVLAKLGLGRTGFRVAATLFLGHVVTSFT